MTSDTVILLGSDFRHGKGGAAKVISSYIDYCRRKDIDYIFLPIHRMHSIRLCRLSPLPKLFLYPFLHARPLDYVLHFHHTSLFDIFVLALFCLITRTSRDRVLVTFHNPKHFSPRPTLVTILHFYLISVIARSHHFLNSRDLSFFVSQNRSTLSSRNFKAVNPLSDTLVTRCEMRLNCKFTANEEAPPLSQTTMPIYVGILSVLRYGKRIDKTISMLKYLPNHFCLVVAGDGEAMKALREHVDKNKLNSRVKFLGWISDHEKKGFFEHISVFVNCSEFDCQPLVIVEAIAYGVPVVSVPNEIFIENYPPGDCIIYSVSSDPLDIACAVKSVSSKNETSLRPVEYLLEQDRCLSFYS